MKQIPEMTELSQDMFLRAMDDHLQLQEAVDLLKSEASVRRVRDTLAYFAKIPVGQIDELKSFLTGKLCECVTDAKPDSIRRKVQMWMKDDALSINKQGAIQIAFALHLNLAEADILLKRLCEEGFHWRDPEEIVYIYGLMHGLSYGETVAVYNEMNEKKLLECSDKAEGMAYTDQVKNRVSKLTSVEELEEYLRKAAGELGKFHNTAYSLFMDFLELLGMPEMDYDTVFRKDTHKDYDEKSLVDIKKYASRDIMDIYLYRRFIPVSQRKSKEDPESEKVVYSAMQRNVRQNWPDEVTLSKMIHRETDVTRKVLILLFLATDGGESSYADDYLDERTPEELFMDVYERLNMMLSDCGFAGLDPRIQFDWMILYCICVDDSIFIDGKIQHFLAEVFPSTGAVPDMAYSDTDE
ncbi:MAG: hypothetical protein IJ325_00060 [Clostridia bacterium]|nr:hypothetical protein [Clostridia bacterium]